MCYSLVLQGARQLGLISLVPDLEPSVAEVSGSSDDEDVPPPLPPPRTESLRKKSSEESCEPEKVVMTEAEPYCGASNGRLVTGSSSDTNSDHSPNKCILTSGKLEEKKR